MTDGTARGGQASGGTNRAPVEDRVLDAALDCLSRWGLAKTTAEDIARAAGISRATLYRVFPGGVATIISALSDRQMERLMGEVVDAVPECSSIDALLIDGICAAGRFLADQPALHYLVAHEPEILLPHFSFDNIDPVLAFCTEVLAPLAERFVPRHVAEEMVEWASRLVLSLTFAPGLVDVTDPEEVGDLVRNLLLPGFAEELFDIVGATVSATGSVVPTDEFSSNPAEQTLSPQTLSQ
ncbi:MAG: TetR/AcrR family transcriptional regulator [Actinobacteria bacterium]|nr:TetR/AcrR family transcriptional regulator [Actinomycetota bacterium]